MMLEELFGKVDFEKLIKDEILKESAEEFQRQYDKHLMTTLYGSSFADMIMKHSIKKQYKKINRRISYEVIWWMKGDRCTKYFHSVKKMKKFMNNLHSCYNDYIEIEKTFCYREHSPRHKWFYISEKPDKFILAEQW